MTKDEKKPAPWVRVKKQLADAEAENSQLKSENTELKNANKILADRCNETQERLEIAQAEAEKLGLDNELTEQLQRELAEERTKIRIPDWAQSMLSVFRSSNP